METARGFEGQTRSLQRTTIHAGDCDHGRIQMRLIMAQVNGAWVIEAIHWNDLKAGSP